MGREEARAKSWNTFREKMIQIAKDDPKFSLNDFILQRANTAFHCWREARWAERANDFDRARGLFLKASESLEQVEKLTENPCLAELLDKLKSDYRDFAVHRDPFYREIIKSPLLWIKENPGVLQTELYKQFTEHKRADMTYALYFAEKEGLIRRVEKGRSYQLFFMREKAADEPLISLQDDDIDKQRDEETTKGCLFFFGLIFGGGALLALIVFGGPIGIGIAIVAFVAWLIIRRNNKKKQKPAAVEPTYEIITPPTLPENSGQNEGDEKSP